jgi:hypothetical protein
MADNFDMKKFLVENKLGSYSRLKTLSEDFADGDDSKHGKHPEEKVEESHPSTEQWLEAFHDALGMDPMISTSYIIDKYGHMKPEDAAKKFMDDATATQMAKDKEKFSRETGLEENHKSEVEETKEEEQFSGINEKEEVKEALTPEMFERMDALTSIRAKIAMIKAAEIMMTELTEEGFDVLDIREYFTQLIANDI